MAITNSNSDKVLKDVCNEIVNDDTGDTGELSQLLAKEILRLISLI